MARNALWFLFPVVLVGCDGEAGSVAAEPCQDLECGGGCAIDADCGEELFCDAVTSTCSAECSPRSGGCEGGLVCGMHGRCAPIEIEDPGCPAVHIAGRPTVPNVLLLLDQSGSMTDPFGGGSRWEAMVTALAHPDQGIVSRLGNRMRLGATLYTSHNGFEDGATCPILTGVAPVVGNGAAIGDLLRDNGPDEDTPTGESVRGVIPILADPNLGPDPRVLVLATDGEPDTCAEPDPQNGQALSIAAVQEAFAAGIRTYVLSLGDEVGAQHLQDLADAGAGLPPGGAEHATYYPANDPAQLISAFDSVFSGVLQDCLVSLEGAVEVEDAPLGDVVLNGTPLQFGDANGWRLVDASTIELLGGACQSFMTAPDVSLSATFPCGSATIF